ncbi:MAG TPA: hypothetical protein VIL15_05810 [Coriobacteriia bacterium]
MYTEAEHPIRALAAAGLDAASLAARPGLAIVEVAGRDSIAAAMAAVRERGFTTLLTTSVATGTEYGDEGAPARASAYLAELLGGDVEVLPPLRLGSPRLWAALNGRFAVVTAERFHITSPCLACHLYMHLARVPLSLALGGVPIVAGERDTHGGRLKLSQTPSGIEACVRILARAGVELFEPIRRLRDCEEIATLVGPGWEPGARQLCCVHSGNYAGLDGEVVFDELAYARYVRGFLEPAGTAVVEAWHDTPEPDYEALVRAVLEGPDAA